MLLLNQAIDGRGVKFREHFLVVVGSVMILMYYFREQLLQASTGMFLVAITFIVCFLAHRRFNHLWWICAAALIGINESYIALHPSAQLRFRPLLMLVFMKQLTIRNKLLKLCKNHPSHLDFKLFMITFAYLFHPQCVPLGGWNPISTSETNLFDTNGTKKQNTTNENGKESDKVNVQTIFDFFYTYLSPIVKGCLFLIGSNCIVHVIMLLIEAKILPSLYQICGPYLFAIIKGFLNAYFVALQFRFSHYFICFTMQTLHAIWDYK